MNDFFNKKKHFQKLGQVELENQDEEDIKNGVEENEEPVETIEKQVDSLGSMGSFSR